jgi:hypothetical protein
MVLAVIRFQGQSADFIAKPINVNILEMVLPLFTSSPLKPSLFSTAHPRQGESGVG